MNAPSPRCRAFVIEALTVGGAERMLVDMANAFARRGDRVHMVCLSSPGELAGRLDAAVELHVLDKRLGLDWRLVPRLRALMGRLRPDVVNAHLWVANTWTRIALLGTGPRIVVTEHSRDSWKGATYRRVDRALARVSDAIVAVSSDTAAFYRDEVGVPADRLVVINNGIDVARYAAGDGRALRASWSPDGAPLVGTVGRLIEAKNHPRFVEAIGRVRDAGVAVRAVIVGEGPERGRIESAIAAAGLEDVVRLVGARDDVPDVLAALDLFVLSSDREGHPLTALEAQAAGTPVVLCDAGGSADAIAAGDGGAGGLLVERDARALADAIAALVADPARLAAMGAFARARAAERFGLDTMVDRYALVLDGRRPA